MNRTLLNEVRQLSNNRCDYCHLPTAYDPLPFQVDHIIAQQHGGLTVLENLAWSCLHCNKHKGPNIAGLDPVTGQLVPIFHPRRQTWQRHFQWDGPNLIGRTRTARATIHVLAINAPAAVTFRTELLFEGVYHF